MLHTLAIAGYWSLRDFVIPLEGLNLVTGPNGSGKSNLYRALAPLATAHPLIRFVVRGWWFVVGGLGAVAQSAKAASWLVDPSPMTTNADTYTLHPIGFIRSTLRTRREAPCQGTEGAPDVWLELLPDFAPGLLGIGAGAEVLVITWLHQANRDVLQVHPRRNPENPLTGVFFTRSPDRPNPLGLHRVTVQEIAGDRLRIGPMEAIDGTPVVDIKAVLDANER